MITNYATDMKDRNDVSFIRQRVCHVVRTIRNRRFKGKTTTEMGHKIGISRQTIERILKATDDNVNVDFSTLISIANSIGLSMSELFSYIEVGNIAVNNKIKDIPNTDQTYNMIDALRELPNYTRMNFLLASTYLVNENKESIDHIVNLMKMPAHQLEKLTQIHSVVFRGNKLEREGKENESNN